MNRTVRTLAVSILLLGAFSLMGCNKLKARDQLNKGVQAYKSARYEQAIENFKNAVALDDKLLVARLYLATAFAQQVVPGVDTPENNQMAQQAIDQFKQVLTDDPTNTPSLKGIASLYFGMKKFDDAKDFQKQVLAQDPNDAEAYYSIGVIDWSEAYPLRMTERAKIGLKPEDSLKDKKVCEAIQQKNQDKVNDGIDMLGKAMEKRQDYDDAMAYMNLMYREKADIECGDSAAKARDLEEADKWVKKTMDTKKMKAEKSSGQGGIVLDQPAEQPK